MVCALPGCPTPAEGRWCPAHARTGPDIVAFEAATVHTYRAADGGGHRGYGVDEAAARVERERVDLQDRGRKLFRNRPPWRRGRMP